MARVSTRLLFWKYALPVHILVFALSLAVDDGILKCTKDLGTMLKNKSQQAEQFFDHYPIDFSTKESFIESRERWHTNFKEMLNNLDVDIFRVLDANHSDEYYYTGACADVHPHLFITMDVLAVSGLIVIFLLFVYQDTRTSFGANRRIVFVVFNSMIALFIFLGVINMPLFGLLKTAVRLSKTLKRCTSNLKILQREMIGNYPLETYYLYANVWDEQRFGVRDPIFGYYIDVVFLDRLKWAMTICFTFELAICCYLAYRSSVKSLVQWRLAIPSVVCIGVVFPNENRLWRIGSGCIVSSKRGLILTNWHLFQRFFSELDVPDHNWVDRKVSFSEYSSDDSSMKGLGANGSNVSNEPKCTIRKHLSRPHLRCESFADIHPEMRIFVGTAERGHPKWQYEAFFTGLQSPSAEYTPFGLDLLMLQIVKRVKFENLRPHEDRTDGDLCYTYSYSAVSSEDIDDIEQERLPKLEIGNPASLRAGDVKLRLLGYPASGGYELSVLTGYFTSLSYDYPDKRRGAWLNINISLPHGGSGGACVAPNGNLIGICTQTKGELTNIRSITEAQQFIAAAKAKVDKKKGKSTKQHRQFISCSDTRCRSTRTHIGTLIRNRFRNVFGI